MKELETVLKVISEGMRTLAGGVATLAEKVDEVAKNQAQQRKTRPAAPTEAKAGAGKAAAANKPAQKAKKASTAKRPAEAKKTASSSATTTTAVLNAIGNTKKGVSSAAIRAKTNLNTRQVSNAVYKLKKAGKIKSVQRGIYVKA